jgi:hypothetical protein
MGNDKSKTEYEKEQKAIREYIAKQSTKRPYQGGATGKNQQKLKNYGNPPKKDDFVYPQIKKQLKDKHKHIDIVFMQGHVSSYYVAEEDAELIKKIDRTKEYNSIDAYFRTSIAPKEKERFINELKEMNKGYAFLNMIKGTDPIIREIVDCSDKNLIRDGDKY